jgi:hypothetical protein
MQTFDKQRWSFSDMLDFSGQKYDRHLDNLYKL